MTPRGWIEVEDWRCKGCSLCVAACPETVLELSPSLNLQGYHPVLPAHPERCTACARCARMCPEAAIRVFAGGRKGVT